MPSLPDMSILSGIYCQLRSLHFQSSRLHYSKKWVQANFHITTCIHTVQKLSLFYRCQKNANCCTACTAACTMIQNRFILFRKSENWNSQNEVSFSKFKYGPFVIKMCYSFIFLQNLCCISSLLKISQIQKFCNLSNSYYCK